jgi:hypothetical protein
MTRVVEVLCLALATLGLSGCATSLSSQQPPAKFSLGFWHWGGSVGATWTGQPVDALYVKVGSITSYRDKWHAFGEWPRELPAAHEYWIVYRHEHQGVPDPEAVREIAADVNRLLGQSLKRGIRVNGIQLDIDSPTGALPEYAAFLRDLRKQLPQGLQISITALLDWFRNGTAVGQVIREVDEFVPQFYDIADPRSGSVAAIAAGIDPVKWGPVFNRFQKRFRVGISTFGRARRRSRLSNETIYGDVMPLDVAVNPEFQLEVDRNPANELVLTYRAARRSTIGYETFEAGEAVQFILSTPDAVRSAVDSVRQIGGYSAGVVFFRWTTGAKTLGLKPEEVLRAAGVHADPARDRVHAFDGGCAAVNCVDVFLESADAFSGKPLRYRIRASTELEYFLPDERMPVRMDSPGEIEVSLPPYCARGRLYLGRAVSLKPTEFTAEVQP